MKDIAVGILLGITLLASTLMVHADQNTVTLPLVNADFSSPAVQAPAKWLNSVQAPGWTYSGANLSECGIEVEYWLPARTPFFFWNNPTGSITQIVDPTKYKVKAPGQVYTLSANIGGQGTGTLHEVSAIIIDGKPAITSPTDLTDPKGPVTPVAVTYTSNAADVGKSIGVGFAWTKPTTFVQAQLSAVSLTVSPSH